MDLGGIGVRASGSQTLPARAGIMHAGTRTQLAKKGERETSSSRTEVVIDSWLETVESLRDATISNHFLSRLFCEGHGQAALLRICWQDWVYPCPLNQRAPRLVHEEPISSIWYPSSMLVMQGEPEYSCVCKASWDFVVAVDREVMMSIFL